MKTNQKKYLLTPDLKVNICLAFLLLEFIISLISLFFQLNYHSNSLNTGEIGLTPFSKDHFFGTDQLGRDVLVQLFLGAQNTFLLSLTGVFLATIAGVFLGSISGFFGDESMKISKRKLTIALVFVLSVLFYGFHFNTFRLTITTDIIFPLTIVLVFMTIMYILLSRNKTVNLPFDIYFVRLVEIYTTLPPIFIIILLTAISRPSPFLFVIYCTLSLWPDFFMICRAEMLKIKSFAFVDAAKAIGQRKSKIIFYHILPNALEPIIVLFAFGFARLLVIESTLSFLGIGLPLEYPGWGKLIATFRIHTDMWWLLIFPGLLIFINVYCIQKIGRYFQNYHQLLG